MRPDTVIDYLHRFPIAVIAYLEYLVFQKKLEVNFVTNSVIFLLKWMLDVFVLKSADDGKAVILFLVTMGYTCLLQQTHLVV